MPLTKQSRVTKQKKFVLLKNLFSLFIIVTRSVGTAASDAATTDRNSSISSCVNKAPQTKNA